LGYVCQSYVPVLAMLQHAYRYQQPKLLQMSAKVQWKVEKFEQIFALDWYWQILFIHYQISGKYPQ